MIIRIDPQHLILCFDFWDYLKTLMAEKDEIVDDIYFDSLLQLVKWIPNAFQHGLRLFLSLHQVLRHYEILKGTRTQQLEGFHNCAYQDLNHDTVVGSWSHSDEVRSEEPLYMVSFDPFLRFLTEHLENFTMRGPDDHNIPGLPPTWVQNLILDLIEAIQHLMSGGFSCRLLNLPKSYVWCEDGKLRLLGVGKKIEDFDPVMCVDIGRFGMMLNNIILVGTPPGVSWTPRDAFLRGFDPSFNSKGSNIPPVVRLEMIRSDPILQSLRRGMFEELVLLDRALKGEVFELENHDISDIAKALKEPGLFKTICSTGNWRQGVGHQGVDPAFGSYLTSRLGAELAYL